MFNGTKKIIISFGGNNIFGTQNRLAYAMVFLLAVVLILTLMTYALLQTLINPQRKIVSMSKYIDLGQDESIQRSYY